MSRRHPWKCIYAFARYENPFGMKTTRRQDERRRNEWMEASEDCITDNRSRSKPITWMETKILVFEMVYYCQFYDNVLVNVNVDDDDDGWKNNECKYVRQWRSNWRRYETVISYNWLHTNHNTFTFEWHPIASNRSRWIQNVSLRRPSCLLSMTAAININKRASFRLESTFAESSIAERKYHEL